MNSCCRTGQMLTKETAEAGLPCTMPRTWGTLGKSFACRLAPSPWAGASGLPQSHGVGRGAGFGVDFHPKQQFRGGICPCKSCDCLWGDCALCPLWHGGRISADGRFFPFCSQVCLFLKRGANQHAVDSDGQDPLSIAVQAANADIVTL